MNMHFYFINNGSKWKAQNIASRNQFHFLNMMNTASTISIKPTK